MKLFLRKDFIKKPQSIFAYTYSEAFSIVHIYFLLHCHALRQISWFIHIQSFGYAYVVAQKLKRELMFRFHGMPFVDLAHLRKSDLKDGYLTLRRRKTGMPLSARVDGRAMQLLERYRNRDDTSPYLLCFLDGNLEGMAAYRDYQRILRLLNSRLRALALWKKVQGKVTSYSARHTWATVGRYCHIPIEVISEGLGHASVTTTEGYMKGFGNSRMDRANKVIMNYIFKG